MRPEADILAFLQRVRRRRQLLHLVRDTGLFVGAIAQLALLSIAGAALLDQRLGSLRLGLVIATVAVLAVVIWHLALVARRLRDTGFVADVVGRARPALRSDLRSVVELGQQLERGGGHFSRGLYLALVRQTFVRLRRVRLTEVVPARSLRPAAILLSVSAVAWASAATLAPTGLRRVANDLIFAPLQDARLASEPLLGDIDLTYIYPAYMRRPRYEVDSSTGHLSAPAGTKVRLKTTALRPCRRAALVVHRGEQATPQRIALTTRSDQTVDGQLTLRDPGWYAFELETVDGEALRDPLRRRIRIEADAIPKVQFYAPPDDIEVAARQSLDLGYAAEDDYGLRKLELVYHVAGRAPGRQPLWSAPGGGSRLRAGGKLQWDLAALSLEPGARVAYWVEAHDNDTISGPKTGRSRAARFKVFSPEARHRETLQLQQRLVDEALRVLAERLLLFEGKPSLPTTEFERIHVAHRAAARLIDGIRELRNRMREDDLVPRAVLRSIAAARRRLDASIRSEATMLQEAALLKARRTLRPSSLAPIRKHNPRLVAELERDALLLADLLDEQRLQSLAAMSRELGKARQRLAKLLERYRQTGSEALRRQIAQEIEFMQRQLQRLVARMAGLRSTIPDEYLNADAIKTVKLGQQLRELDQLLKRGELDRLQSAVAALDRQISQLQQLLSGGLQDYRGNRMNERERAFAANLDRLRGLEAEQRQLLKRTNRIVQGYQRRAEQLMRHEVGPVVRSELSKLKELRKLVAEIDGRRLPSYHREQIERVGKRVDGLGRMLRQRDLDQALNMAQRTTNALRTLVDDLVEEVEISYPDRRAPLRRALRQTRKAKTLAAELERDLESIFPAPQTLLEAGDRRTLRQLRRRQQALRRATDQLAQQIAKSARGQTLNPVIDGQRLPQGLRQSSKLMDQAVRKLGAIRPQEARSSQEAAAERLAQLQQQLKRSREGRVSGPRGYRERVEIPGAEAYSPPRAFRRDILDAMKEKPPPRYESQVRRYYEELVK